MSSVQFSSVQLFSHPFDSMGCSMPGFPVHYHPLKLAQTHVYRVCDAIQPSHPVIPFFSIFSSNRVFSYKSVLHIMWLKYWNFSLSLSPSNEYSGLVSFRMTGCISFQSKQLLIVFSNTSFQKHQFFGFQLSLWSNSHIHT